MNDLSSTRSQKPGSSGRCVCRIAALALLVCAITVMNPDRSTTTTERADTATENREDAIPVYSERQDIRARQLIFHSEDLRHVPEIWERLWEMEMPDVATPYRVHGGVI